MTNEEAKVFLDNLKICINEHPIVADWLVEIENRNDEPSNSEIPNNCEHITEDGVTCAKYPACGDCLDNPLNKVKGSERSLKGKDEPQSVKSSLEPFRVDEPQTCEECKHWSDIEDGCADRHGCKTTEDSSTVPTSSILEQVDEPQYEMGMGTLKCDNCSEYGSFKCTKCDGEMYFKRLEPKDEPQTEWHYDEQDATWYPYKHEDEPQQKSCATCKHALGNWDGESNNCGRCCGADRRFYEPKDEPQTEMPRCSVNGTPFDECGFCEYFNCDTCKCEADVPQTERSE